MFFYLPPNFYGKWGKTFHAKFSKTSNFESGSKLENSKLINGGNFSFLIQM